MYFFDVIEQTCVTKLLKSYEMNNANRDMSCLPFHNH